MEKPKNQNSQWSTEDQKAKVRSITPPGCKTYYKATIVKTMCYDINNRFCMYLF